MSSMGNSELKNCRLIINWDTANMWNPLLCYAQRQRELDAEGVKTVLEQIVDEHAKAQIDRIVHCGFVLPWGTVPPGFQSFDRLAPDAVESSLYRGLFDPETETGIRHLEEAGYDFFRVLLDRAHKKRMQFLIGMRMNDRHRGSTTAPFYGARPEWRTTEPPPAMDYKHEGLRRTVLAVAEESLERYDADGIELDWMRWCHAFNPSEAQQNASLLTDFTAKMRALLDRAAKNRKRDKLLLGVRVPQTIEECRILGFDVEAWVQHGLADYICPSDFAMTDLNTRTEQFTALTEGTSCRVYPSVHPQYTDFTFRPTPTGEKPICHTVESYRAAAKNFYAFGADGVSAYNYQDPWVVSSAEWPRALFHLTSLRSPREVAQGDRHYRYYPTSPILAPGFPHEVADKHEKTVLDRDAGEPAGSLSFRMAEDLRGTNLSATLAFKVAGLADGDEIQVSLNGSAIPAPRFERILDDDRRPVFHLYRTSLDWPPARFGDNELLLRLTKSGGAEELIVQEIEVLVRDRA